MRTRGSLSNEYQIKKWLDLLDCSGRAFCLITGFSQTTFERIMQGNDRDFTPEESQRLRDTLDEMATLQSNAGRDVPVNWSATGRVKNALCVQRIKRINKELGFNDLDGLVVDAPKLAVAAAGVTREPAVLSPNGI